MKRAALQTFLIGLACVSGAGQMRSEEPDYSAELPRIEPLSPEQELRSFDLLPGFRVELVASEPLVRDPVAFAFNGQGHLFVVEMRDYSEQETEHLGSIARLVDTNRDGQMDQRTTFAEGLSWPTAIWPWKDGVLVAEPPNLIWLRDTDGDGISEQRELWYTGFGRSNVQGLVNSLRWTVEGYIEGATSSTGAELTSGDNADDSKKITLRGRDFVLDPLDHHLQPASGGGQHGMAFNRWGDKFVTSNSDHLQQIIDIDGWLSQHTASVPVPPLRRSIAVDGPQAEVFRSSPVEPWRIVRTRLRVSGAVPGVVEGGGRAAGYFTGATGTWIMDREAGFGDGQHDTALVCDVGSNLVHRKRLIPNGLFWSGERIDRDTELLRSSDIWFRPVQLGDGPDGALYIADMYREVIEHPKSLPPVIKKHLDLTSGRDRGRIWRLVPTTATTVTKPNETTVPEVLSSAELAAFLHHPVTWQRRMASQLLIERRDASAVPALENAALRGQLPEGRLLALHVLNRYGKLSDEVLENALKDQHPRVVEHAVRLVGESDRAAAFAKPLERVAVSDAHVQLALSMTAERLPTDEKIALLRKLVHVVTEPLTRATIIISAGNASPQLFASDDGAAMSSDWLKLVLPAWNQALRGKADSDSEFRQTLAKLLNRELAAEASSRAVWTAALAQMPNRAAADVFISLLDDESQTSYQEFLASAAEQAMQAAVDRPTEVKSSEALRWLRLLPEDELDALAEEALSPTAPEPVQLAYAEAMLWNDPDKALSVLLPELKRMTPALKREVLMRIAGYSQGLGRIADALEQGEIAKAEIAPDVRQQLFAVPNAKLAARFKKLLTTASADRAQVIERYRPALADVAQLSPEQIAAGRMTFRRVCAQCHRLEDMGNDVGPPLKQLGDKSPEQLLDIVLDPNREVDPKFLGYSVLLGDGRVLAGIIREESAGQIVLAEAGGKQHTIARSDIEQIKTTGLSLMPVGLEEQISPEQMKELIGYLKQAGSK
ncbi:MAG: PVC-type heme-binding CxxCH protein [Aureliella sp.]